MKVIYGIGKAKRIFKNAVVAIGVFDGLHIGHQKLIKQAVAKARSNKGEAVVMTFAPHPVQVLQPKKYLPYIDSLAYRLKLFEKLGVATTIVVHFTRRFAQLSPTDFVERYLVKPISPKDIFVGSEFRFGKNASGTVDFLKEAGKKYGFKLNAVSPLKRARLKIGSSGIRQFIADGKLGSAQRQLGRYVSVMGKVVKGDKRGAQLGFPTANLTIKDEVMPPVGVYAVYVQFNQKRYKGMANIGVRPSFKTKAPINIEVHLFNFRQSIYGKEILVEFVKKIRNEKVFPTKEKLILQLHRDQEKALQILT